jgi:hypothetical protein
MDVPVRYDVIDGKIVGAIKENFMMASEPNQKLKIKVKQKNSIFKITSSNIDNEFNVVFMSSKHDSVSSPIKPIIER